MIENKKDNIDILNIKYVKLDNLLQYTIYPIYSTQINQGNYLEDTLLDEIENKLNTVSKKIYDYYQKIFIERTYYNSKISLNTEIITGTFIPFSSFSVLLLKALQNS